MRVRKLILRAHVWLLATLLPLLVKVMSLQRLLRLLTPPERFKPYAGVPPERIVAVVARRLRQPRHMRRRACLRKGLLLFHVLCLSGTAAVLHVGVFPPDGESSRMQAHCWVSVDGHCVSGPPEGQVALGLTYSAQTGALVSSAT